MAESFFSRLKGLIGRSSLHEGEGMLFPRCNNIHMWFMRIPIDVVFLRVMKRADGTTEAKVTSVHESVRPWRVLPLMDTMGTDALELPEGTIRRLELKAGDDLCIA